MAEKKSISLTKMNGFAAMKDAEYVFWQKCTAAERMGAVSELSLHAYRLQQGKGVNADVPRLQRILVRTQRV